MILVVGLGNPGKQYQYTRHNVGFMAAGEIAREFGLSNFSESSKFSSHTCSGFAGDKKLLLAKPTSFMNNSGIAVRKLMDYYKLPMSSLIVIHDDLDLACGKIKVKLGGGHAGHNGLRSIDGHLGNNYYRLRIGIGKPEEKSSVNSYVLKNFSKDQQLVINKTLENIAESAEYLFEHRISEFINACNNNY
jgi:PTH1 family peptidyl-tRNA hydrolase